MALAISIEIGRCSDVRLRQALLPLAAFGFLHGGHEWLEMFLEFYLMKIFLKVMLFRKVCEK